VLTPEDQRAVEGYFAAWQEHVEGWRAAGGPWRAFEGPVPVASLAAASLAHADPRVRRACLGVLDHEASDESVGVFRAALHDPVPRVRVIALHGLVCERCRDGLLCAADVASDVARLIGSDPSPKVRHAAVVAAWPLAGRDDRVAAAVGRAAAEDGDDLVRAVAAAVVEGRPGDVRSRKALRRRSA